jgi:hypothetical protein
MLRDRALPYGVKPLAFASLFLTCYQTKPGFTAGLAKMVTKLVKQPQPSPEWVRA